MSQPVLSLKNVTITQGAKIILSNVNLEVNHGEFIYIIGKTGSGKSSFMKALYADLPLAEGEGTIVNFDLVSLKEDDIPFLRRKIGFVFQDFKLLPDRTVKDNLLFVLKATGWKDNTEMQNKIDEVLDKVGMKEFANKMPRSQHRVQDVDTVAVQEESEQQRHIVKAREPVRFSMAHRKMCHPLMDGHTGWQGA